MANYIYFTICIIALILLVWWSFKRFTSTNNYAEKGIYFLVPFDNV